MITYPGEFKHPHLIPPEFNLSNLTPFLHGDDKQLFLEFVERMLQRDPKHQSTARELYNDPWLSFKT